MVKVTTNGKTYDYPNKKLYNFVVEPQVSEDFSKLMKKHGLVKSRVMSDFCKAVLLMDKMGRLEKENYTLSINLKSSE